MDVKQNTHLFHVWLQTYEVTYSKYDTEIPQLMLLVRPQPKADSSGFHCWVEQWKTTVGITVLNQRCKHTLWLSHQSLASPFWKPQKKRCWVLPVCYTQQWVGLSWAEQDGYVRYCRFLRRERQRHIYFLTSATELQLAVPFVGRNHNCHTNSYSY